jgi:hypothetical protein
LKSRNHPGTLSKKERTAMLFSLWTPSKTWQRGQRTIPSPFLERRIKGAIQDFRAYLSVEIELGLGRFHFDADELAVDHADDVWRSWRAHAVEAAALGLERTAIVAPAEVLLSAR